MSETRPADPNDTPGRAAADILSVMPARPSCFGGALAGVLDGVARLRVCFYTRGAR
jgi:hypothetical protein